MTNKKEILIKSILDKCKLKSGRYLTPYELSILKDFIKTRLEFHGCLGYLFGISINYKKQLLTLDNIDLISIHVLKSNHVKY